MTLESFAHLATVVTLMILVYVQAKPAVNRWAAIRYLRWCHEFRDDLLATPREVRLDSWARRLSRAQRGVRRGFAFMLMRRVDPPQTRHPDVSAHPRRADDLITCRSWMDATRWWPRRCSCPNTTWRTRKSEDVPVSIGRSAVLVGVARGSENDALTTTSLVVKGFTEDGSALRHLARVRQPVTTIAACALKELRLASKVPQLPDTEIVAFNLDPEHPDLQDY